MSFHLPSWVNSINLLSPVQKKAMALTAGLIAAAALPPMGLVFFLVPAFSILLWLIQGSGVRAALAHGWWFGLGFFSAGFYWIGNAFFIDAERYGWLAPFAVMGIASLMAVYAALATGITKLFSLRLKLVDWAQALCLAIFWTFTEYLRAELLTGLPWNLIGSVWVVSDVMLQAAAWIGIFGLGTITIAAASLPSVLASEDGTRQKKWLIALSGITLITLIAVAGALRLVSAETTKVEGIQIRLVQPNIPQHLKWHPDLRLAHVHRQLTMTQQPSETDKIPTHVIWPETAIPYNLAADPALQKLIGSAAPKHGLVIAGAPRGEGNPGPEQKLWNSAHAISPKGTIISTYDKKHLVPFGEYVPMRNLLRFSKLTDGRIDFLSGSGPRVLNLPGLPPVAVLICYEVIFPNEIPGITSETPRPNWLLNITNDAWFGNTAGPYQHLAAARLRAVEHGLPLVRVANTGISAIIDPYGRIIKALGLGQSGVIDMGLPISLKPTVFSRIRSITPWSLILLGLIFLAIFGRCNRPS